MNELELHSGVGQLTGLRDPQQIMQEASEGCQVLTDMVERTKSYTQIGTGRHLRVEAWVTLANFYGCTGRIVRTEEVEIMGVHGSKAHAQVVNDQTGNVLSSADALCMTDEENWSNKPLHQVMSMAQTRALSKALAAKFRWVVVLGGWAATPAEEMTGNEAAPKAKAKEKPAPKLPFGRSKGKAITDPEVPLDDLQWMQKSRRATAGRRMLRLPSWRR